jgi:hypothetical protein
MYVSNKNIICNVLYFLLNLQRHFGRFDWTYCPYFNGEGLANEREWSKCLLLISCCQLSQFLSPENGGSMLVLYVVNLHQTTRCLIPEGNHRHEQIMCPSLYAYVCVCVCVWDYHLCVIVARVPGYRSTGPGFDSRLYQILWEVVGLERGPLSLVSTIEELLGIIVAASV